MQVNLGDKIFRKQRKEKMVQQQKQLTHSLIGSLWEGCKDKIWILSLGNSLKAVTRPLQLVHLACTNTSYQPIMILHLLLHILKEYYICRVQFTQLKVTQYTSLAPQHSLQSLVNIGSVCTQASLYCLQCTLSLILVLFRIHKLSKSEISTSKRS